MLTPCSAATIASHSSFQVRCSCADQFVDCGRVEAIPMQKELTQSKLASATEFALLAANVFIILSWIAIRINLAKADIHLPTIAIAIEIGLCVAAAITLLTVVCRSRFRNVQLRLLVQALSTMLSNGAFVLFLSLVLPFAQFPKYLDQVSFKSSRVTNLACFGNELVVGFENGKVICVPDPLRSPR